MRRRVKYREAADHLGIPEGTLRAKVSRKEIPHYRIGGRSVVFDIDELDAWLASKLVRASGLPKAGRVA